jgi:hypothetical protein
MSDKTDRELLEVAARAAGISLYQWVDKGEWMDEPEEWGFQTARPESCRWNPLTDDGDALRLAVKLGMLVDVRYGPGEDKSIHVLYWKTPQQASSLHENGEALSTTRRAIVRAAAAMGE